MDKQTSQVNIVISEPSKPIDIPKRNKDRYVQDNFNAVDWRRFGEPFAKQERKRPVRTHSTHYIIEESTF